MDRRSGVLVSILLVFVGLMLNAPLVTAQSVCPIKTVKVRAVRGSVVENLPDRLPVSKVLVELRLLGDDERTILSTTTDERGLFQLGPIKEGTYALEFSHDIFARYRLIVKTKGTDPSIKGLKGSSILVMLGPDCFNTEVILGK